MSPFMRPTLFRKGGQKEGKGGHWPHPPIEEQEQNKSKSKSKHPLPSQARGNAAIESATDQVCLPWARPSGETEGHPGGGRAGSREGRTPAHHCAEHESAYRARAVRARWDVKASDGVMNFFERGVCKDEGR